MKRKKEKRRKTLQSSQIMFLWGGIEWEKRETSKEQEKEEDEEKEKEEKEEKEKRKKEEEQSLNWNAEITEKKKNNKVTR